MRAKTAGKAAVTVCALGCGMQIMSAAPAQALAVRVGPGMTVYGLASRFHVSEAAIVAANHLANPRLIDVGTLLRIPARSTAAVAAPAGFVTVGAGETLWSIAVRYHSSVAALAASNGLRNANYIFPGERLRVPHAAPAYRTVATVSPMRMPASLAGSPRIALAPVFRHWAAVYGVSPAMLEGLAWWESGWNQASVSSTGAIGLGQLEPATVSFVKRVLIKNPNLNPYVASDNIQMSAAYLRYLMNQTGWNSIHALASYYEGLALVRRGYPAPGVGTYVHGVLACANLFGG